MNELVKLTARQAVSLLKAREVSPLELIEAAAGRIAEVEASVNAMPTLCLERARAKAKQLMARPPLAPASNYLYGLPVAIKDLTDVAGVRTTYGSPIFAQHVPDRSDYLVEMLEANGAIVIGKTNTPEFGAGSNTFNDVFGATLNPWNTAMTCGGSSGGSAVALATGEIWLATGNDLGGSLRIPASFCAVVGFRPSPGRVASGPRFLPFDTMGVEGPMGRNVADVALMLDAQVGQHAGAPLALPPPGRSYLEAVDHPVKPLKIGYSADLGIAPVDPAVRELCAQAAQAWTELGVTVEERCPDFSDAAEVFQTLRAQMYVSRFGPLLEKYRARLKPEIIWNIEKGLALTADEIGRADRKRAELYHRTVDFFKTADLLICPTVIAPPFDVNLRYLPEVNGVRFDSYIGWLILTFATTLIACPSISVPCGFTAAGLPVGIQITGPPRCEDRVLSAAALFEQYKGLDRFIPIDPRPKAA
jgi:amidase